MFSRHSETDTNNTLLVLTVWCSIASNNSMAAKRPYGIYYYGCCQSYGAQAGHMQLNLTRVQSTKRLHQCSRPRWNFMNSDIQNAGSAMYFEHVLYVGAS